MCRVFGKLLNADLELGAIVFYSITNTHARNRILDQLLQKRYGKAFDDYWNGTPNTHNRKGMFAIIRQLDQRRNEIVHWHMKYAPGPDRLRRTTRKCV